MHKVYALGLSDPIARRVEESFAHLSLKLISESKDWIDQLVHLIDQDESLPTLIFIGDLWHSKVSIGDMRKALKNSLPDTEVVMLVESSEELRGINEIDLGLAGAFAVSSHGKELTSLLRRHLGDLGPHDLRPAFLLDLRPGDRLDFETYLYLPANRKYLKFTGSGAVIDQKRLSRMKEVGQVRIFVESENLPKFYKYAANRVRSAYKLGANKGMGLTERNDRLSQSVGELLTSLFDPEVEATFEQGKDLLACCQGIISNFITNGRQDDWYDRVLAAVGGDGQYALASSSSTLAALVAIGLGLDNPEDLAFAGLFADIGLSLLPPELAVKEVDQLTDQEKAMYYTHPQKTVEYLQSKRVNLKENVIRAILEHHEAFSGLGCPNHLVGQQISQEGQVLAFTVQFVTRMKMVPGKRGPTPQQVIEQIQKGRSINPELLSRIKKMFNGSGKSES